MDTQSLISRFGLLTATFLISLVSSFLPMFNTEVFLLAVGAVAKTSALPGILLSASLGQMLGKCVFYMAGRGLLKLPLGRHQARFDEWTARLGRSRRGVDVVMFSSALWGVPPFLVVPYLAGMFKLNFARFLMWGILGRFLRFGAIVLLPAAIKALSRA